MDPYCGAKKDLNIIPLPSFPVAFVVASTSLGSVLQLSSHTPVPGHRSQSPLSNHARHICPPSACCCPYCRACCYPSCRRQHHLQMLLRICWPTMDRPCTPCAVLTCTDRPMRHSSDLPLLLLLRVVSLALLRPGSAFQKLPALLSVVAMPYMYVCYLLLRPHPNYRPSPPRV